jgi:hypothetical protein
MAQAQAKAPWTKIFTAFKVALDLKKLLLAAAGILLVSFGWWVFGWSFYIGRSFPEWKYYERKDQENLGWNTFKSYRDSWNLMHELAGDAPTLEKHYKVDAGDVAESKEEYLLLDKWEKAYKRSSESFTVTGAKLEVPNLVVNQKPFTVELLGNDKSDLDKLNGKTFEVQALQVGDNTVTIDGIVVKTADGNLEDLKKYRDEALTFHQIVAKADLVADQKLGQKALDKFKHYLVNPKIKAGGLLRTCPLSEPRGVNPYLLVTGAIKTGGGPIEARDHLLAWFVHEEAPVLLEPLYKFLMPLKYLFDRRAGVWERLYLILVILWMLAVWGFFGGAICRIAAVQITRNERISLKEAILFTRARLISFVTAPMLPLALLAGLWVCLVLFGVVDIIPWFGDLVAGLFWPVVLIIGFIMAVVLVGLIAWPLMIATISVEGSDSFDALSRSYSYLYQAPWQLAWSSFLAVVYGAVLVFFVGFMASLLVFLGKWGVSGTPFLSSTDPKNDREPSYLFYYAPTSFGWRDLLISQNQFVETHETVRSDGHKAKALEFKKEYTENLSFANYMGAGLMVVWIWPLFLLVVGFGYSYFWSASTIIYTLMRRHVDDTELDEVYLEDDEIDQGFSQPPPPAAEAAPASKPGTVSLNVVEAPPPVPPPAEPAPPPAEPAPSAPPQPSNNPPPV